METNYAEMGKAIAMQMYRLEHCEMLTTQEACMLLGCKRSTLYKKGLPHNQYGWNKKAVVEELTK